MWLDIAGNALTNAALPPLAELLTRFPLSHEESLERRSLLSHQRQTGVRESTVILDRSPLTYNDPPSVQRSPTATAEAGGRAGRRGVSLDRKVNVNPNAQRAARIDAIRQRKKVDLQN